MATLTRPLSLDWLWNASPVLANMVPVTRRLIQLYGGLILYGTSMALQIRAGLGLDPWDVFHQGVADHTGLSFGTVTMITGAAVLLAWIPLRQWPGLGTVSNVVVIGLSVDAALSLLPAAGPLPVQLAMLGSGVFLNGVAGAAYIGAGLGPGPRDGLMTGLVRRTGGSVRVVRTAIEVVAVLAGWALGGTLGVATVLYTLAIGPLVHPLLPRLTVPRPDAGTWKAERGDQGPVRRLRLHLHQGGPGRPRRRPPGRDRQHAPHARVRRPGRVPGPARGARR